MERYITKGVQEQVPFDVQVFCWSEYDKCKQMDECDYLHVYKLKRIIEDVDGFNLVVIHEQEEPVYRQAHIISTRYHIDALKIYIINDGMYQTMLLASEY